MAPGGLWRLCPESTSPDSAVRHQHQSGGLDGVCDDVAELKTVQAVESARAKWAANDERVRADQADHHVLSYRFRVGIAVAAIGGIGGLLLGLVNFVVGH